VPLPNRIKTTRSTAQPARHPDFLGQISAGAALAIALLLVNISIEMTLPRFRSAITQLRESAAGLGDFPLRVMWNFSWHWCHSRGRGFILGLSATGDPAHLGDIRAAIYDAISD